MKIVPVGEHVCKIGESAQENWELIDQAKKQGWFFHLTDFPSPYVVLECGKSEPNAHIRQRCAEICVENSKQKNSGKVKVDATPVSNVKVDKKDEVGECDYKNEGKVEIIVVQACKKNQDDEAEDMGNSTEVIGKEKKQDAGRKGRAGKASASKEKRTSSPALVTGEHTTVRKSPAGGWATISFKDAAVRNAILRDAGEIAVKSGISVTLQPQVDPKTKEEVTTDIFASWGRKAEEKVPVSENELLRCFESLAQRATEAIARAAPTLASGANVAVRKAAAGGCAVVSFLKGHEVREAVLAMGRESALQSGVAIKLQPQRDPKTKEEVPTDIFVAWGRKVEEKTPVSESELVSFFDELCARTAADIPQSSGEKDDPD